MYFIGSGFLSHSLSTHRQQVASWTGLDQRDLLKVAGVTMEKYVESEALPLTPSRIVGFKLYASSLALSAISRRANN